MPLAAKGEFAQLRTRLESALDMSGQPVRRGTMAHDHHVLMLLADAAAQQRDPAGLEAFAPWLAALAERDDHRLYQGIAARAQGVARRLEADYDAAGAHLERAQALFEAIGARWQRGRTLRERAELARLRHDPAAARGLLSAAAADFETLGATPDLTAARSALATLS